MIFTCLIKLYVQERTVWGRLIAAFSNKSIFRQFLKQDRMEKPRLFWKLKKAPAGKCDR